MPYPSISPQNVALACPFPTSSSCPLNPADQPASIGPQGRDFRLHWLALPQPGEPNPDQPIWQRRFDVGRRSGSVISCLPPRVALVATLPRHQASTLLFASTGLATDRGNYLTALQWGVDGFLAVYLQPSAWGMGEGFLREILTPDDIYGKTLSTIKKRGTAQLFQSCNVASILNYHWPMSVEVPWGREKTKTLLSATLSISSSFPSICPASILSARHTNFIPRFPELWSSHS
ncbi:hypothetical protein F5884DRAFT_264147 [Xylogone sp. PMI_703]|nr:hypothetical protein F5884DRAFT_264147 [Xylogone sp. PMI_703]